MLCLAIMHLIALQMSRDHMITFSMTIASPGALEI